MRKPFKTGTARVRRTWLMLMGVLWLMPAIASAQDETPEPAADNPFSDWVCQRCPEVLGWWGNGYFGPGWVSDDSLRFGSYRGLEEKGFYAALDGDIHFRDAEGRYLDGYGRDLGLDSRELDIKGGRQGRYEFRFAWHEIPFYRGYGAQTPFTGQGSGNLTLPGDWQHASGTSGMTRLASSLQPAPLGLQREILDAGLVFRPSSAWSFEVDVQRQTKNGTRPFGGAGIFINNASQLPAPVDFTTDRIDAGIAWGNQRAQLRLGFSGSWFDNGRTSLTWDNPFDSPPETLRLRSALEPANDYYQFNLTGAYALTPRIHLSGSAAVGEASQDEVFLPYSINPEYSDLPLPRATLDGRVDSSTFNLAGKLVARLNSRLSITARAKYDERDNRTPVDEYTRVISDIVLAEGRANRPFGFERSEVSADVRYRLSHAVRLSAGGKRTDLDRTLQAVEQSDETTWWGEVKLQPWAWSQIRLRGETARRDIDAYHPRDDGGPVDHPLFRKFNQADRDRDRMLAELYLTPAEGLGVNLNLHYAKDDYEKSEIGLQRSRVTGYTVGADYAMAERITLYAYASRDDIESDLDGSYGSQAWTAGTDDRIATVGAGLTAQLSEKSRLGVDAVWADTDGDIAVQTSLQESPFPTLRTTLKNLRLHFSHDVRENWGYRLLAEFENYDSSDWAIDGLGVDGLDPLLAFGLLSPNYSAWKLWAQASYRF